MLRSNPQSPYFDNRLRNQPQQLQHGQMELKQDQIYERQPQRNPFLQDNTPQMETPPKDSEIQSVNSRSNLEQEKSQAIYGDKYSDLRSNAQNSSDPNAYNRDVYGELNLRSNRTPVSANERLLVERRTPDAYGRSATMSAYNKGKVGDYEDVYGSYAAENEYGKTYAKSPNTPQSSHQQSQDYSGNYVSLFCINVLASSS
jgi:hypothetical protein